MRPAALSTYTLPHSNAVQSLWSFVPSPPKKRKNNQPVPVPFLRSSGIAFNATFFKKYIQSTCSLGASVWWLCFWCHAMLVGCQWGSGEKNNCGVWWFLCCLWWLFDATWKEKKKHSTCVVGGGGSAAVVRGDAASSTCRIASVAIHFLWATFHPLKK